MCYPPPLNLSGLERMSRTSERKPRVRDATIDRLAGWARSQFDAWGDAPARSAKALREQLERLEPTSPSIFLFDFAEGSVGLRRKSRSWPELGEAEAELLRRAKLYLTLFRDVVTAFELDCTFPLAIDVDDHPQEASGAPLFAFQKRTGSPLILLPDIDILGADYFVSPDCEDPFTFDQKADAAIFVGATTGDNITREVVETLSLPRLKSAVFFKETPDVTFRLPKIVQYDAEETADMVRALGVSGLPASWEEQFGYRYLLSMDGNGATCSRVAVALKSHSVLIKYESEHQLFYFGGLEPGENFLSVARDEDVHDVLKWCRRRPVRTAAIAQAGRQFARTHLSRLPVAIYVAHLLDGYGQTVLPGRACPGDLRGPWTVLDAFGHVQNVGDTAPGPSRLARRLAGRPGDRGVRPGAGSWHRSPGCQLSGRSGRRQPVRALLRVRLLRDSGPRPAPSWRKPRSGRRCSQALRVDIYRGLRRRRAGGSRDRWNRLPFA